MYLKILNNFLHSSKPIIEPDIAHQMEKNLLNRQLFKTYILYI